MANRTERRASALPSPAARAMAFAAIMVGALCGGMIGWALADMQCTGSCGGHTSVSAIAGALLGGLGVAVIAVLALRAMGEWNRMQSPSSEAQ